MKKQTMLYIVCGIAAYLLFFSKKPLLSGITTPETARSSSLTTPLTGLIGSGFNFLSSLVNSAANYFTSNSTGLTTSQQAFENYQELVRGEFGGVLPTIISGSDLTDYFNPFE